MLQRSVRSESQPEASVMLHNNGKPRSFCSTSRSAADRQTTGPNKRAVVSHVRTRSLDRSSPRAGKADNRGSLVNHVIRSDVKNLQDYLPRKLKKKTQTQASESPLYSPETLSALENAEKLIKEAQKRILEAAYDVHSSPERDSSARSGETKSKDDESLYIRDVVATRFHEANESGRIYTRVTARRPAEKAHKPEARQPWQRRLVDGKLCGKERTPQRATTKNKKSINLPEDCEKPTRNSQDPRDARSTDKTSQRAPRGENSKAEMPVKFIDSKKQEDQTPSRSFGVQEGPRVDIRNELTITSVEKIDISPWPPSFPVQRNVKTYEFRHGEPRLPERADEPRVDAESRDEEPEADEKSAPTRKNPAAVSSSERGSSSDLLPSKSGRSIESERLEGPEATGASSRDPRNTEKPEKPAESFIEFLQRHENRPNGFFNHRERDPEEGTKIEIFDRAVRRFFRNFRRADETLNNSESEVDCPDGKSTLDRAALEKSDVLYESSEDDECPGDNWDLNEINLEAPNFGELDEVLRKFDGTMNKVLQATRNLGFLMSEYSIDDDVADRFKAPAVSGASWVVDQRGIKPRNDDIDLENKNTRENPPKDLPRNANLNASDSTDENRGAPGEFSQAFSRSSQSEGPKNNSPLKSFLDKTIISRPRYSTPLNNDLKLGKSFDNANRTPNDFANFFSGIRRSEIGRDGKLTSKQEISGIEKINGNEKLRTAAKQPSVASAEPAKNQLETKTQIFISEIEKKCNFQSLFNRERSTRTENTAPPNPVALPTSSAREVEDPPAPSSIGKPTTAEGSTQNENSNGAKIVDEFLTRRNSSKCESSAAEEIPELCENSTGPKSGEKCKSRANFSVASKPDDLERTRINETLESSVKSNSAKREKTTVVSASNEKSNNFAAQVEEPRDRNSGNGSPESSTRDRTSFDISSAYSEDFEEASGSSKKLSIAKFTDRPKDSSVREPPNEAEVSTNVGATSTEAEDTVASSKTEQKSLPKITTSTSMKKSNGNEEKKPTKCADDRFEKQDADTRAANENSVEKKADQLSEIDENSSNGCPSSSSPKSSKMSRTGSSAEGSRRGGTKAIDTCGENYSEGELYLPSSCSYSLGEIRISELGTCTPSAPGVESSVRNADTMRIFFSRSLINTNSADNTSNAVNSLGEIQETDVEITDSN
ncbi:uncharacterized protein [Venturia canescens]|uniref:uncharacterized protein isoform X2 n=1 Tax=Venturia canescens TaxID=32260 RepID=UPI001C9D3DA3|nr:uncharacterized protein LOC122415860 isoform X2 [Venturia canescens]